VPVALDSAFAGMTSVGSFPRTIPAVQTSRTLHPPRPSEGAFREASWGGTWCGAPAGLVRKRVARGGVGLPPGSLRSPARSWLTTVRSISNAARPSLRSSARPRDTYGESGAGAGRSRKCSCRAIAALLERIWRAGRRPACRKARAI